MMTLQEKRIRYLFLGNHLEKGYTLHVGKHGFFREFYLYLYKSIRFLYSFL